MNTLKFYPRQLRESYEKNIKNAGIENPPEKYHNFIFYITLMLAVISMGFFAIIGMTIYFSLVVFIFLNAFIYFKISLKASARIKKMETIFPDVISLMASNLRSGMTIDKSFLLAARPEFDPLDKEILKTGKEITTGQDIIFALKRLGIRVNSEKISKVVTLIISGLRAGGNISDLLDQTSKNMKEKEIIEKKARSTILMYVIFVFFAVGVGAPILFGLSSILVEIVMALTSKLPEAATASTNLPLSFKEISISPSFVIYFSLFFIAVTDLISCIVIGLVNKGEGKAGLRYFLPLLAVSYVLFFIIRSLLSKTLVSSLSVI
jgi:hypothetical protein